MATLAKALAVPSTVRDELMSPKYCGSYGSLLMAATFTAPELRRLHEPLARGVVYVCGSVQLAMVCW